MFNNWIFYKLMKWWTSLIPMYRDEGKLNRRQSGIYKDETDKRDYKLPLRRSDTPPFFELVQNPLDYVKSQGKHNSCASHAMSTGIEILHNINRTKYKGIPLSERYHYFYARLKDKTLPKNVGMTLRTAMKIARRHGLCPERLCPYISSEMNKYPVIFTDSFASWWRIKRYYRLGGISDIKEALIEQLPVVIGIRMNASFQNYSSKIVVRDNEKLYGGHGVLAYGFDEELSAFKCINSWGERYKFGGTMNLPYDYVHKYGLDFWTFTIYKDKK